MRRRSVLDILLAAKRPEKQTLLTLHLDGKEVSRAMGRHIGGNIFEVKGRDFREGSIKQGSNMNVQEKRAELVHNIRAAISQKFIRDTGSDIECWITEEASAVHGRVYTRGGVLRFTIPVVVLFEPEQNVMAGRPMEPVPGVQREDLRECRRD